MTKYDLRLEKKTYYSLAIFYAKGNQDKSLLNLNSDAYTNATITNYGFFFTRRKIWCRYHLAKGIKSNSIPNV
jgi:hypothetical protein